LDDQNVAEPNRFDPSCSTSHPSCVYPTVAKGPERLRITPSPYHEDALIDELAEALVNVWEELGLPRNRRPLAAE
jgi:hypothetical protein